MQIDGFGVELAQFAVKIVERVKIELKMLSITDDIHNASGDIGSAPVPDNRPREDRFASCGARL